MHFGLIRAGRAWLPAEKTNTLKRQGKQHGFRSQGRWNPPDRPTTEIFHSSLCRNNFCVWSMCLDSGGYELTASDPRNVGSDWRKVLLCSQGCCAKQQVAPSPHGISLAWILHFVCYIPADEKSFAFLDSARQGKGSGIYFGCRAFVPA